MAKCYAVLLFVIIVYCAGAQNIAPVTIKEVPAGTVKFQGGTNTCWSCSTTSMLETQEILSDKKNIDLSELFTSRNMFIEKAKRYILSGGTTLFEAGALSHDALYGIDKYGAIPNEFYPRKKGGDFSVKSPVQLDSVLKKYLDSVLRVKPIDQNWLAGFI